MHVQPLDDENQAAVVKFLRRAPYRNGILLSNVTQLRAQCEVMVASNHNQIIGVATHYRPLPFMNLVFAIEHKDILPPLIEAMGERVSELQNSSVIAILPEIRLQQLLPFVEAEALEFELQMAVEPETLREAASSQVRRLKKTDLPEMNQLAHDAGLTAWVDEVLDVGPSFGSFEGERLVSMASTHYATTDVIEIGHVATHPDFRRKGHARACVSALCKSCFGLAPRVYLMVLEHNTAAIATYRSLGFQAIERFGMITFRL
jgi:ribosomal protein S18 acetylase RimI-like enzyme